MGGTWSTPDVEFGLLVSICASVCCTRALIVASEATWEPGSSARGDPLGGPPTGPGAFVRSSPHRAQDPASTTTGFRAATDAPRRPFQQSVTNPRTATPSQPGVSTGSRDDREISLTHETAVLTCRRVMSRATHEIRVPPPGVRQSWRSSATSTRRCVHGVAVERFISRRGSRSREASGWK